MNTMQNSVQLIGHLGRNPEIKILDNGNKVAKILLATSEYRKNQNGEKQTHTIWHNVSAWGNAASLAEKFLIKGKKVALQGKINNRLYTDKDGVKRNYSEIIVNQIQLIA
jgi:single-strand DNA-binding protein